MADNVKTISEADSHTGYDFEQKKNECWFLPLSDLCEDDENYYIDIELPGIDESDVDVEINNDALVVIGRAKNLPVTDERLIYEEFQNGSYHRHFALLDGMDKNNVRATMKNGVLSIRIPKKEKFKPIPIKVQAE